MDGFDWSTAANVGSVALAVCSLLAIFRAIVGRQTKSLIAETAVSAKTYMEDRKQIREDIEVLKKSDAEFRVMQSQIQNVQRSVESLKVDLKNSADQQRADLNGGLARVSEDMREFTKAVAGKP